MWQEEAHLSLSMRRLRVHTMYLSDKLHNVLFEKVGLQMMGETPRKLDSSQQHQTHLSLPWSRV